jgi:hypothetical protein
VAGPCAPGAIGSRRFGAHFVSPGNSMNISQYRARCWSLLPIAALLVALSIAPPHSQAAAPGQSIVPLLQDRLGLNEVQVRGALGALLVFVRERLPKQDFDDLAETIPNADRIMQDVKQRGIVTRPLDNMDDYESALSSLGIGQPLASKVAPAVLQSLGDTGHTRERDILARVIS